MSSCMKYVCFTMVINFFGNFFFLHKHLNTIKHYFMCISTVSTHTPLRHFSRNLKLYTQMLQYTDTLTSHCKPWTLCGKFGSCLPMVGSLQYRTLTTVCTGSLCPQNYPSRYDLYSVESYIKTQISKLNTQLCS